MSDVKDKMISDAIKTALDYSHTIIKLKRIILIMGVVIFALIMGYFVRY